MLEGHVGAVLVGDDLGDVVPHHVDGHLELDDLLIEDRMGGLEGRIGGIEARMGGLEAKLTERLYKVGVPVLIASNLLIVAVATWIGTVVG